MIEKIEKALKLMKESIESKDPRIEKYKPKVKREYKNLKKELDSIYDAYHRLSIREEKIIAKYDLDYLF